MQRESESLAAAAAVGRLETWFAANGWRAFEFQHEVWNAYLNGESGLVHSATGTGKTLAAWLGALAEWLMEQPGDAPRSLQPDRLPASGCVPLRALWITPMR